MLMYAGFCFKDSVCIIILEKMTVNIIALLAATFRTRCEGQ